MAQRKTELKTSDLDQSLYHLPEMERKMIPTAFAAAIVANSTDREVAFRRVFDSLTKTPGAKLLKLKNPDLFPVDDYRSGSDKYVKASERLSEVRDNAAALVEQNQGSEQELREASAFDDEGNLRSSIKEVLPSSTHAPVSAFLKEYVSLGYQSFIDEGSFFHRDLEQYLMSQDKNLLKEAVTTLGHNRMAIYFLLTHCASIGPLLTPKGSDSQFGMIVAGIMGNHFLLVNRCLGEISKFDEQYQKEPLLQPLKPIFEDALAAILESPRNYNQVGVLIHLVKNLPGQLLHAKNELERFQQEHKRAEQRQQEMQTAFDGIKAQEDKQQAAIPTDERTESSALKQAKSKLEQANEALQSATKKVEEAENYKNSLFKKAELFRDTLQSRVEYCDGLIAAKAKPKSLILDPSAKTHIDEKHRSSIILRGEEKGKTGARDKLRKNLATINSAQGSDKKGKDQQTKAAIRSQFTRLFDQAVPGHELLALVDRPTVLLPKEQIESDRIDKKSDRGVDSTELDPSQQMAAEKLEEHVLRRPQNDDRGFLYESPFDTDGNLTWTLKYIQEPMRSVAEDFIITAYTYSAEKALDQNGNINPAIANYFGEDLFGELREECGEFGLKVFCVQSVFILIQQAFIDIAEKAGHKYYATSLFTIAGMQNDLITYVKGEVDRLGKSLQADQKANVEGQEDSALNNKLKEVLELVQTVFISLLQNVRNFAQFEWLAQTLVEVNNNPKTIENLTLLQNQLNCRLALNKLREQSGSYPEVTEIYRDYERVFLSMCDSKIIEGLQKLRRTIDDTAVRIMDAKKSKVKDIQHIRFDAAARSCEYAMAEFEGSNSPASAPLMNLAKPYASRKFREDFDTLSKNSSPDNARELSALSDGILKGAALQRNPLDPARIKAVNQAANNTMPGRHSKIKQSLGALGILAGIAGAALCWMLAPITLGATLPFAIVLTAKVVTLIGLAASAALTTAGTASVISGSEKQSALALRHLSFVARKTSVELSAQRREPGLGLSEGDPLVTPAPESKKGR